MTETLTTTKKPHSSAVPLPRDESRPSRRIRDEFERFFDDLRQPHWSPFNWSPTNFALQGLSPVPAIDMHEDDGKYLMTAELPGLSESDIEISVADGVLTVSGEKKEEREESANGCMMRERRYGSFERSLRLPSDADPDAVDARFDNGVLSVTIGKDADAEERVRKIAIKAG